LYTKFVGYEVCQRSDALKEKFLRTKLQGAPNLNDLIEDLIYYHNNKDFMVVNRRAEDERLRQYLTSSIPKAQYDTFVQYKLSCNLEGKLNVGNVHFPGKMVYEKVPDKVQILDYDNVWDFENDKFRESLHPDKHFVDVYLGLHSHLPSQHYAVSNENLPAALSRYMKARTGTADDDVIYEKMQDTVWKEINRETSKRLSLTRHFKKYKPEHEFMSRIMKHVTRNITGISEKWEKQTELWKLEPEKFRTWYCSLPHAKKEARESWNETFKMYAGSLDFKFKISAQLKREIAKYAKAPRLYVTYNEYGIFIPWLFELLKHELEGLYDHTGNKVDTIEQTYSGFRFLSSYVNYKRDGKFTLLGDESKYGQNRRAFSRVVLHPDPEILRTAFRELYDVYNGNCGNCVYTLLFSDDTVVAMWCDGKAHLVNMDISSCDMSIGPELFKATSSIIDYHLGSEYANKWLKQHMQPVALVNPNNPRQRVALKFKRIVLGSGSTATTWLDTLGSLSITAQIIWGFLNNSVNETADLKKAAAKVGFAVTLDVCHEFEQVQFLKNSPYIVNNDIYYARNFGAIVRGFGTVYGHLEPHHFSMPTTQFNELMRTKAGHVYLLENFLGSIVASYVHEPNSAVLRAFRERFDVTAVTVTSKQQEHLIQSSESFPPIPVEFYHNRYGLNETDIDELVSQIHELKIGTFFYSEAVKKFLEVDYGYDKDDDGY